MTRVGGVLGRVAGVLSDKMGKVGKGKAAAGSGETWYQKKCRENPNFKVERAETARNARQAAAAADRAAAAPAAAAAAPAATAEAETATSPGFLERTMPRVFGRTAPAAAQQQPAPGGAPVSGGYTTAAALDGQRYPSGSSPSEVGYHAPEWAGLKRVHQLLGVQLLEPGLLREEQLTRAAQRLARGEMPFNVGEWAASSAAFLVYGDFGPLETADGESLWGRRVIDDNFRFVGTNELAVVAGPTDRCPLSCGAPPRCCSRRCRARTASARTTRRRTSTTRRSTRRRTRRSSRPSRRSASTRARSRRRDGRWRPPSRCRS